MKRGTIPRIACAGIESCLEIGRFRSAGSLSDSVHCKLQHVYSCSFEHENWGKHFYLTPFYSSFVRRLRNTLPRRFWGNLEGSSSSPSILKTGAASCCSQPCRVHILYPHLRAEWPPPHLGPMVTLNFKIHKVSFRLKYTSRAIKLFGFNFLRRLWGQASFKLSFNNYCIA